MLCKNCGKRMATTHIKQIINGEVQEYHLCGECASKLGVGNFNPFEMSDLFGSIFGNQAQPLTEAKRCKMCGSSFSEIAKKGRLGCPECYNEFREQLLPSLRKMHGKTNHIGKIPGNADSASKAEYKLKELKNALKSAIAEEEFEKAATLRDEIKTLEKEMGENE